MTHNSTPFRLNKVVLVRDPTDPRHMLAHILERLVFRVIQKFWGGRQLFTVAEPTPAKTMQALVAHGFHPSTIPVNLGGEWTYDCIDEWMMERLQIESQQSALPVSSIAAVAPPTPSVTGNAVTQSNLEQVAPVLSPIREFVIETDLIRRARDQMGVQEVPEKVRRARERNAEAARRCYHKKKVQKQVNALQSENDQLRAEEQRLESLLQQAKDIVSIHGM